MTPINAAPMMNDFPQQIPGADAFERAVNLAGLLATRGIVRLRLEHAGCQTDLAARTTSLPDELLRHTTCTLHTGTASYVVNADHIRLLAPESAGH